MHNAIVHLYFKDIHKNHKYYAYVYVCKYVHTYVQMYVHHSVNKNVNTYVPMLRSKCGLRN